MGFALVSIDSVASYLEDRTNAPQRNIAGLRDYVRDKILSEQPAGPGALFNMLEHLDAYEQAFRDIREMRNRLADACRLLALNRARLGRVRLGVGNFRVFQIHPLEALTRE